MNVIRKPQYPASPGWFDVNVIIQTPLDSRWHELADLCLNIELLGFLTYSLINIVMY